MNSIEIISRHATAEDAMKAIGYTKEYLDVYYGVAMKEAKRANEIALEFFVIPAIYGDDPYDIAYTCMTPDGIRVLHRLSIYGSHGISNSNLQMYCMDDEAFRTNWITVDKANQSSRRRAAGMCKADPLIVFA